MAGNCIKFHLLCIGTNDDLKKETVIIGPNYDSVINEKETVRDLGILMDNKLNFKAQQANVISKTNKKSGWVLRTFKSRQVDFIVIL